MSPSEQGKPQDFRRRFWRMKASRALNGRLFPTRFERSWRVKAADSADSSLREQADVASQHKTARREVPPGGRVLRKAGQGFSDRVA